MNKLSFFTVIGISLYLIATNGLASEIDSERKLINKAIVAMENCLHWGGEIGDQSAARTKQILIAEKRDCAQAKLSAKQAYDKYPNNMSLASQLVRYIAEDRFVVNKAELKLICRYAAQFYENNTKNNYPVRHWYFEYKCLN